jgi:hypothetical protein
MTQDLLLALIVATSFFSGLLVGWAIWRLPKLKYEQ